MKTGTKVEVWTGYDRPTQTGTIISMPGNGWYIVSIDGAPRRVASQYVRPRT